MRCASTRLRSKTGGETNVGQGHDKKARPSHPSAERNTSPVTAPRRRRAATTIRTQHPRSDRSFRGRRPRITHLPNPLQPPQGQAGNIPNVAPRAHCGLAPFREAFSPHLFVHIRSTYKSPLGLQYITLSFVKATPEDRTVLAFDQDVRMGILPTTV